jgi:hypothetical protein
MKVKNKKILLKETLTNVVTKLSPKAFLKNYIYDDITEKCKKKSKKKIKMEEFEIPVYEEFDDLIKKNYNVSQLKSISRKFGQKVSGNKKELIFNLYNYLKYSYYSIKIQKVFRKYYLKKFFDLHGPALFNKNCLNDSDFLTFQKIKDIPFYQLYTYKDKDGFTYGFDICSIYNMLKDKEYTKNPYNRNELPENTLTNIKKIVRMSKRLNFNINIKIKNDTENMSVEKKFELEAISLFQEIDQMGFITDSKWLTGLSRAKCIHYIRELDDVWNYRAQISQQTKRDIISPNGALYVGIGSFSHLFSSSTLLQLKQFIFKSVKRLISKGINDESKSLGCFYALGTFTIVCQEAANSLPWLYESFLLQN